MRENTTGLLVRVDESGNEDIVTGDFGHLAARVEQERESIEATVSSRLTLVLFRLTWDRTRRPNFELVEHVVSRPEWPEDSSTWIGPDSDQRIFDFPEWNRLVVELRRNGVPLNRGSKVLDFIGSHYSDYTSPAEWDGLSSLQEHLEGTAAEHLADGHIEDENLEYLLDYINAQLDIREVLFNTLERYIPKTHTIPGDRYRLGDRGTARFDTDADECAVVGWHDDKLFVHLVDRNDREFEFAIEPARFTSTSRT